MAYMRSPFYVWRSGEHVHIEAKEGITDYPGVVVLPMEVFDALVVMRYAQLTHGERHEDGRDSEPWPVELFERRIAEEYDGHFGADALRRKFGLETSIDRVVKTIKGIKP